MINRSKIVIPLFAFVLLLLSACSGPDRTLEELIVDGEPIYITSCARCHQLDGEGFDEYPALAGNPVVTLERPAHMIDTVINGRSAMPAFRGTLDEDELVAVLTYIRNSWGNSASPIDPKQVR
jgi:cytochrome c oxidase subunit II